MAKYDYHSPLARQVRLAKQLGVKLTTQTLWDQIWGLAQLMMPLHERIKGQVLRQSVIGMDLTGFKLIAKGGAKSRQVWQLSSPTAIYFEILKSKKAKDGEQLFKILDGNEVKYFGGTAVADGAAELLAIANRLGFQTAGCWSHARRKVLMAKKEAPGQVDEFLDQVGQLYEIDKKAIRDPVPGDERPGYRHRLDLELLCRLRDTESRAVCDKLKAWILKQSGIPGGLLKGGLEYIAKRWTLLTRFVDDPRIPLDNNLTESRFVGLALGRRNYIGARSERGTEVAAVFYTIVESARINGLDARAYLRYAASAALKGDVALLPHEWNPAK